MNLVVIYICVPVVIPPSAAEEMGMVASEPTEIQSCKEIVHEIRQRGITFPPLLKMFDKFEQVALEPKVYEYAGIGDLPKLYLTRSKESRPTRI